jgi:hypothetical protein
MSSSREERTLADALQSVFKDIHGRARQHVAPATIATEGEKVKLSGLSIADMRAFHAVKLLRLRVN